MFSGRRILMSYIERDAPVKGDYIQLVDADGVSKDAIEYIITTSSIDVCVHDAAPPEMNV